MNIPTALIFIFAGLVTLNQGEIAKFAIVLTLAVITVFINKFIK